MNTFKQGVERTSRTRTHQSFSSFTAVLNNSVVQPNAKCIVGPTPRAINLNNGIISALFVCRKDGARYSESQIGNAIPVSGGGCHLMR